MALASSVADFDVMSSPAGAASATSISGVRPAAATTPAAAAELRKSRRPQSSLMADPPFEALVAQLSLFLIFVQVLANRPTRFGQTRPERLNSVSEGTTLAERVRRRQLAKS